MNTDVLIIGGGVAGISAALWCKRLGMPHLLVERRGRLGGQLHAIHNPIVDYPGLTAGGGKELAALMATHLESVGAVARLEAEVERLDPEQREADVRMTDEQGAVGIQQIRYKAVILATGAADRRLGVPGEAEMRARGEIYSATRDAGKLSGKRVAVIGGGDRAFEGALLLAKAGSSVLLVHRSDRFRARDELVDAVRGNTAVRILTDTTVARIEGGPGGTEAIGLSHADGTTSDERVQAVFVRIGVEADSYLFRPFVRTSPEGRVPTNEAGLTSVPGHYAVGDVATDPVYSSIVSSASQAMAAVKHILHYSGIYRDSAAAE